MTAKRKAERPRCVVHVPPFDSKEMPDTFGRPGYVRCECTKCGALLGYRDTTAPTTKGKRCK